MAEPKEMSKPVVKTRQPKKVTGAGIFDNLRQLPHPVEELLGLTPENSTPSTPSTPSTDPTDSTPSTETTPSTPELIKQTSSVSPQRDYMKVANSITRQAIPSRVFGESGGKSKELYDCLYGLTRGAVIPRRKIRIPKDKLMRAAGIGSEVTLKKNLQRLLTAKLIKEFILPGAHGGNEYEVFLPEEFVRQTASTPSTPSTPSTETSSPQYREGVEALGSRASTPSLSLTNSVTSEKDKTLLLRPATKIDDDEAYALFIDTLKTAVKEITGKESTALEGDRWREVAEVLIAELKIAAARTTVSSVPSFLAEHLRRRLWKLDKKQARAEGRELPDEQMKAAPVLDSSQCPDCGGSGWWYPEGESKGVAKCRHAKLKQES
jgi:hypothetical protein